MLAEKNPSSDATNSNPNIKLDATSSERSLHRWFWQIEYYSSLVWEKIIIIILLVDGVHGLYLSGMFFFVLFPELERKLAESLISTEEMRLLLAEAIGLIIATIIGISLAIRLTKSQEKLFRYIELVIGTAFVIYNRQITLYLSEYDYSPLTTAIKIWLTTTF